MEISDVFKNNLKGEMLSNALDLVEFLIGKGLSPVQEWDHGVRFVKNEKSPCLIFVIAESSEWVICDLPVATEPEWNSLRDDLQEFITSNIKICSVHEGNSCGCGSEPGMDKTIFGKSYSNVCTSEIQIVNPCAYDLGKFKEIVEWWADH